MLRSNIWIGLLILCGTIVAEDIELHNGLRYDVSHATDQISQTERLFGFTILDESRKLFCRLFCSSPNVITYNFCSKKCSEYLHPTTTESTTITTVPNYNAPSTMAGTPTVTSTFIPSNTPSNSGENTKTTVSTISTTTPSITTTTSSSTIPSTTTTTSSSTTPSTTSQSPFKK